MRQANRDPITSFRLSSLIRDPHVRAAFERAERDYGQTFAIPDEPPEVLDGGAAESVLNLGESFAELDHPPRLDADAAEFLTGSGARRVRVPEVV